MKTDILFGGKRMPKGQPVVASFYWPAEVGFFVYPLPLYFI
jgi:hypothetical protein